MKTNTEFSFLQGGGEMGKLTREKDWSKTPLGSPDTWPQSLRTTLSIVIHSKFPMFLFWGPNLICFYNDYYRPSLGEQGKHPAILGMRAEDAWPEIWHIIKPLIDQVLNKIEPTWSENQLIPIFRNGKMEEVYWTFGYSPVFDESEKPAGVLVTCTETTEKIKALEEVKSSEQRFKNITESTDILIGLSDETSKATYFNTAWVEITGKSLEHLLAFGWADLIHPDDRDSVLNDYLKAFESKTEFTSEFRALDRNNDYRWFLSKGTPCYSAEGEFTGYISSSLDITSRKKAEVEVERFKFIADFASDPFILMREDGSFEYLNELALEKWGYTAEEAKSLKVPDVDPIYHEELFKTTFQRAQKEALPLFETLHKKKDGTIYPVEIQMKGLSIQGVPYMFAIARDITERKRIDRKLKASERNLRLMIHQAPVAIAILRGSNYVVEIVNKHSLELWGRKENEVLGKEILNAMPELNEQGIKALLDDVYQTGNRFVAKELPVEILRGNQLETVYINFSYEPLYDDNKVINGIMTVGFDVSDQVKARLKIEANREKLNVVIQASELGTWEYNLKTHEINYSNRYLEIFGYEKDSKLPHNTFLKQIHKEDLPIRQKAFEEAFAIGSLHYKARIFWPDNSLHWMEAKGTVFYKNNEPYRMIGTVRDITEEKNIQQQLIEREQKFRLLADSMPQHVWTSDPMGNLNYFNQSVFDFSGLTQAQIDKDGWIQIVHPDDREENIKQWKRSIETGEDFLIEHRFKRYDGTYRWQLSRAIPQRDEDGNIRMWVGSSTDIQDQKMFLQELEKQVKQRTSELARKNKDLEKMNKELQSFAYISSHDLQEPLRKIQTFASRIIDKEKENLSEKGVDYLSRMQNAANRMQTLIEDLLAYSRTSTGELKFKRIPLDQVVNEVSENLKEEIEQKQAKLEVSAPCKVHIIHFQFQQLLTNLISNSLKFARPGIAPIIKISSKTGTGEQLEPKRLQSDRTYCHIRVQDNGVGFDKKHSEIIFELFQRLYGKSEYKGTGIGLAIVKKIVENHNGIVNASGEKDQGATFDIYIPTLQQID